MTDKQHQLSNLRGSITHFVLHNINTETNLDSNSSSNHTMDYKHSIKEQQQHTCAFCMDAVNASC